MSLTELLHHVAPTAPIKVDAATDELVSHAAHLRSRSKKDIVDAAAQTVRKKSSRDRRSPSTLHEPKNAIPQVIPLFSGLNRR